MALVTSMATESSFNFFTFRIICENYYFLKDNQNNNNKIKGLRLNLIPAAAAAAAATLKMKKIVDLGTSTLQEFIIEGYRNKTRNVTKYRFRVI